MKAVKEEIVIDAAGPEDLPEVLDLWAELMVLTSQYNRHYEMIETAKLLQESYLKAFFDSSTAAIFAARDRARIAGFANVYITKPAPVFKQNTLGVIENLYVLPEYRRRGLGRRIVERAHQYFSDFDTDEIYVNVIVANEASEKFWSAMGYQTQKLTMARAGSKKA